MKRNRFEKLVNTSVIESKDQQLRADTTRSVRLPVSVDFSGSPLNRLLSEEDVRVAVEFLDLMRKNQFPGSDPLKLRKKRVKKPLSEWEMLSKPCSKVRKSIRLVGWVTLWRGKGYLIGSIYRRANYPSEEDCCKVYLCGDGRLRCMRSKPVFDSGHSYASGFGTIPTEGSMDDTLVFSVGRFSVTDPKPYRKFISVHLESLLKRYVEEEVIRA